MNTEFHTEMKTDEANAAPAGRHGDGRRRSPSAAALCAATILSGLSAGFFFTYQFSVIRGFAVVDDVTYVRMFQAINATVRTPWFGLVFFGTVPAIALALGMNWRTGGARRTLLVAGLILGVSTVLITMIGNVPLNDALAEYGDVTPPVAGVARAEFEGPWNELNAYRTATSIVAFVMLALAWLTPAVNRRESPRNLG